MEITPREMQKVGRLSKKLGELRIGGASSRSAPHVDLRTEQTALLALSAHAVWVITADGKVSVASKPSGLAVGDVGDAQIATDDRDAFWQAVERAKTSGEPVSTKFRDCHNHHYSASVVDLTKNPAVRGVLVDACDITEEMAEQRSLAQRDALTGLMTRDAFLEETLARSAEGPIGVLLFDLDGFKLINNSLGHAAGDYLLIAMAQRLQDCLRQGDVACRHSGDEFTVLIPFANEAELFAIGRRILHKLQQTLELDGRNFLPSVSLGVVFSAGEEEPETILRNADLALMRGRERGRGRITVFEPVMNADILERMELESDLRIAVERKQFELFYQPIVDLQMLEVQQLEALIRWNSPTRGIVSPLKFIPIAEETGLIVPIGAWVLQEGMMQAQEWRLRHGLTNLTINLNLSTRQLLCPDLIDQARDALLASEIPAEHVKLEITESVMMENLEDNLARLRALRDLGFQLAVDDFGTGYSSLAYLSRLPISTLKVDRSFVDRLGKSEQDDAIVRSIVGLARSLGLTVTSEGVETIYQLDRLRDLQCDHGQGYFFYRPMPAWDIEAILEEDAIMRRAA